MNRRIVVSVTSDLVSDNRVHKVCNTLEKMGFNVLLVGRKLPGSLPLGPRTYETRRMTLIFTKGPFFYAEFNLRLFFLLLFSPTNLLLSNDLDTLPANFLASRLRKKPLIYDSHEYFTEMPELLHRPKVREFWAWLERKMLPHTDLAYTVCRSIADIYTKRSGREFHVIRNVPYTIHDVQKTPVLKESDMVLYQGALNIGRGLEQVILAMKHLSGVRLVIAGDGDIRTYLEDLVRKEGLVSRVLFAGRLPLEELAVLTKKASLGLSVEEDLGLNYRFALPNKLFDYIQSRVPVLVTDLPEMASLVNRYQIGLVTGSLDPVILAKMIDVALNDKNLRAIWTGNLEIAANELNWENEEKILQYLVEQTFFRNPDPGDEQNQ